MKEITYKQAINEAVDEEMRRDAMVFLLGEDVRTWGAPYGDLEGLFEKYPDRVFDTPISERAIVGAAIGAAMMGMRPVASMMFVEFLGVCFSEIANTLVKTRYMTGGMVKMPITLLAYCGAGISAAGQHSDTWNGLLMSIPGLKIVFPSTPHDAKGLLKSSIREDNPVVFLSHQFLLGGELKSAISDGEYLVPLGKADIKREGKDVTVVATALMVHRALAAAKMAEERNISLEIIDPRTLVPLDKETIIDSVKKTGRLVIIDEEPKTGSAASEIAATVAEEAFNYLKAPIKRVCAPETPVPFSLPLEKEWMPAEGDLLQAIDDIM
jgi:pyruvate/2-oxoglutarate/acetoin dehydrogenase E1 component